MVSRNITYIAMQIVMPLHTPQLNTHQFTVSYMISTLSKGELLTVEHHRMSTLCQLSTQSNNRYISSSNKGLTKVRQRQNWSCCQLHFQQLNCFPLSITLNKLMLARQQV